MSEITHNASAYEEPSRLFRLPGFDKPNGAECLCDVKKHQISPPEVSRRVDIPVEDPFQ